MIYLRGAEGGGHTSVSLPYRDIIATTVVLNVGWSVEASPFRLFLNMYVLSGFDCLFVAAHSSRHGNQIFQLLINVVICFGTLVINLAIDRRDELLPEDLKALGNSLILEPPSR